MRSPLRITVLGELAAFRDGRRLVLPASRKTRALLAYLAVVRRPQRRDHLCRMLWDTAEDPRASLRWSLSKLRQAVGGEECIIADESSISIKAAVDLSEIDVVTAASVGSQETGHLESLATLFRGRFIEDLELPRCPRFEAWRVFHADAVDRTRWTILQTLVERLRSEPERALPYAHALLEMDPADASTRLAATTLAGSARDRARRPGSAGAAPDPIGQAVSSQTIHYCRSTDGTRIAYAVSGQGPPLLRSAHWMSHLQFEWESPVWRHWIEALSSRNTLIRYDERGNGLSDWNVRDLSFAAMVCDLESVADAVGADRFALMGVSQSCAVSVAYAVRHPERISGLILYGGYARGWRKRDEPHEIATHEAMTTLIREGWGKDNPAFRQMFTETFIPGATLEQMSWFNELQRRTATPSNAAMLHAAFGDMDVTALLGHVAVPTLVLHARDDEAVPFEEGKALAAGIQGARFVVLDSPNHILLKDEAAFASFVREVESFLSAVDSG